MPTAHSSRSRAFAICAIGYGLAAVAAFATIGVMRDAHPIVAALVADVVATSVVFAFSYRYDNSSVYDPYWSVAPLPLAIYWIVVAGSPEVNRARLALVLVLVTCWGARLTWNWARSWSGLDHEDWRYRDKRDEFGRLYWPVSFAGIHLFPTLCVFAGCLPLYGVITSGPRPLGPLDAMAVAVTACAIWLEATADKQLLRFRHSGPTPEDILASGLWAYSRHPNYLGEISFWWGLYLFALAADPAWWWTGLGALVITLLFRIVSLPLIETRMRSRRPGFEAHASRVPMLLPRPGRRAGH